MTPQLAVDGTDACTAYFGSINKLKIKLIEMNEFY